MASQLPSIVTEGDILEFKGKGEFLSNFYRQSMMYKGIFWSSSEHAYQVMKIYRPDEGTGKYRHDLSEAWLKVFPNVSRPATALMTQDLFMLEFARLTSPGQAKKAGKRLPMVPNFHKFRIEIMEDVIRHKFAVGTTLAEMLLATTGHLEEGNYHGDDFWGVDLRKGTGDNHLGKILMARREELKSEKGT